MSAYKDKPHLLTIAVEDYFQVSAFGRLIQPRQWTRFETRIERNTLRALDLLDEFGIKATFFALGWVADRMPEVIRWIVARGHEVASKGYYHRNIGEMVPSEFREDLLRSREAIERAGGHRVLGYRVARGSFGLQDLWALDVLAEEGLVYDSSIYPRLRAIAREPWRRFVHQHHAAGRTLWEFPLSTWGTSEFLLPAAGGNYFRQAPHSLMKRVVRHWHEHYESPFTMYFHVWELDSELPEITAAGTLTRIRQYRNLEKMPERLRDYFREYRHIGIARYLGIKPMPVEQTVAESPVNVRAAPDPAPTESPDLLPITIVIPCFNEELILPYFANTIEEVLRDFRKHYRVHLLFVDDGSSDGTWHRLHETFGPRPDCTLVRHTENRGVAAAILTGIGEARTEVVCSIDCDCTYDPRHLLKMIPRLEPGIDLVTASPYHPEGEVLNVPEWRLFLSKSLSRLYSAVLRDRVHTFTSCCRVYRREAILPLRVENHGFLGIAEILIRLKLAGGGVVEVPATLESRLLGESKMKVARTIGAHLGFLGKLVVRGDGVAPRQEPSP